MPDYFERFVARAHRELSEAVEAWGQSITALSQWEDDHLLDSQSAEDLAAHRRTIEELLRFGKFLSLTTAHPEFPDKVLSEQVAATLELLQDKIPLWHGTMSKQKAEEILRACFPE